VTSSKILANYLPVGPEENLGNHQSDLRAEVPSFNNIFYCLDSLATALLLINNIQLGTGRISVGFHFNL
jgi:hypothetical protein